MTFARTVSALVALLLLATPAGAQPAPELYVAQVLEGPAEIHIDGVLVKRVCASCAATIPLAAGPHKVRIVTATGTSLAGDHDFETGKLSEARGGRYWCLVIGGSDAAPELFVMAPDRCLSFIGLAPKDQPLGG